VVDNNSTNRQILVETGFGARKPRFGLIF